MADEATTEEVELDIPATETESPEESTEVETPETEETKEAEATDEEADDTTDGSQETDEEETPEPVAELDPKERNRQGYAERTRIRSEVSSALDELAKPQTADELIEEGFDPAEARVAALEQDIQRKEAINHLTELNQGLNSDAVQVEREFPIFNDKSPDYDEEFTTQVRDWYARAAGLQRDPSNKFFTQANVPLYDFFSWAVSMRSSGAKQGAVKGQRAAEKMLASAETPSSTQARDEDTSDEALFFKGMQTRR